MSEATVDEVLEVVRVQGLATVQDLGIRGFMHEALPLGGAMVPRLLAMTNGNVGNAPDACGLEVFGRATLRALREVTVSIGPEQRRTLAAGEEIELESGTSRCTYLAVREGLRGIPFRGRFRGAILAANIGAPLIAGARLTAAPPKTWNLEDATKGTIHVDISRGKTMVGRGKRTGPGPANTVADNSAGVVRIVPGPDLDAFADEALAIITGAHYRILPASNRVGTRLAGAALPRRADYRQRSYPMTIGAIEVPADGQPIVFGPEHPVTGGHPLIGVIESRDLDRFHAIPLGGSVHFAIADAQK